MEAQKPVVELAMQAIRLCLAGETLAGVEAYRQALACSGGHKVPVGLHLMQLASGGHAKAAELVRQAALETDADVSVSWAFGRQTDPRNAIAEYEALFTSGTANARMVSNYMTRLSLAGESAGLAAVAAPEKLFRNTALRVNGPLSPFLRRVSTALRNSVERRFFETEYAARNMDRVHRTHRSKDPAILELHAAIRVHVAAYLREIAATGHVMAKWLPSEFELRSWAVISDGTGHLVPHIHSGCWVIGVVYIEGTNPALSNDGNAGVLRIGAPPEGVSTCPGWPQLTVPPVPGTIVLMPAFYTHWVEPIPASSSRISVAFNVIDAPGSRDTRSRMVP